MNVNHRLQWDYTGLAETYDRRVNYHEGVVASTLLSMQLPPHGVAIEVGAGTGKLTSLLCKHGLTVFATEPNERMRHFALSNPALHSAYWVGCTGDALPFRSGVAALAAYGSSFNVMPAQIALNECARVLAPGGHWLAIWNHRDLEDPLQSEVEALIRWHIPEYDYGSRRASPAATVRAHGSFDHIAFAEQRFVADVSAEDWMLAWQSHATLERQAGVRMTDILRDLRDLVANACTLRVPYFTRVWTARRNSS